MLQKSQNRRKYPCDSFREVGSPIITKSCNVLPSHLQDSRNSCRAEQLSVFHHSDTLLRARPLQAEHNEHMSRAPALDPRTLTTKRPGTSELILLSGNVSLKNKQEQKKKKATKVVLSRHSAYIKEVVLMGILLYNYAATLSLIVYFKLTPASQTWYRQ